MRAFAVVTPLLLASALGVAPAHAAGGRIDVHAAGDNQVVGNGVLALAVCVAHTNVDVGWVPEQTSVWCTVNGYRSATQTNQGGDAAVTVINATTAPVTVCVYASAVVTSPLTAPMVLTTQACTVEPSGVYG